MCVEYEAWVEAFCTLRRRKRVKVMYTNSLSEHNGQEQPRDLHLCLSLPHRFPRPLRELIPAYCSQTQKMLRMVNGEEKTSRPAGLTPASPHPRARHRWQSRFQNLHL